MGRVTDEDRYRAFVLASADVVYRMSPDWSEMRRLDGRGFLSDTPAASSTWMDDYILPEDRERVAAAIDRAIRTRSLFELEHPVRRADGTRGWTLSRAAPIIGDDGEIAEWLGTATDLTEKREAAERLRASEERLRQFGENSPDTLWIMDVEAGRLEYLSPAYEAMWGEPRERVMDDLGHWLSHVHRDDRGRVAQGLPALLAGERCTIEYRITRPDGGRRWILDTGFPIRDAQGRIVRLAGIAQDVTVRRAAEDKVRASERRLRTLSEGIPQLVWRAADEGRWTWASPQWTAFTGQPEPESRGWGWLEMVHPDDRATARNAWDRTRFAGSLEADYRLRRRVDGLYRWFTTRAAPVEDESGRVVEWLGTSTDIDDLRRLQAHQQLLLAELQHRVRNSLAVIRSIARRTAATSDTVEEFGMHLDGRLGSFSRTQAAVTRDPAAGLKLRTIIADELLAHATREGEHAHIDGPEVTLQPKAGETLALAFHELATNSVKFGALAAGDGVVRVGWRVERDGAGRDWLAICWDESRPGPAAPPPTRRGFGTELLEDTLGYELEADTLLVYRPEGLLCTISLPFTKKVGEAE